MGGASITNYLIEVYLGKDVASERWAPARSVGGGGGVGRWAEEVGGDGVVEWRAEERRGREQDIGKRGEVVDGG